MACSRRSTPTLSPAWTACTTSLSTLKATAPCSPPAVYTFAGSTMGGGAVTVKDNKNGTFTIENVTGNIVIVTEKV